MSSITVKAHAKIEERSGDYAARWGSSMTEELALHRAYEKGAATGYAVRAAEELSDEQVAQIIDQHRMGQLRMGGSVQIMCTCGHQAFGCGPHDLAYGDNTARREADRGHAAHVAAQLRAARDTGEEA